jgi:hypothetical protein
MQATKLLFVVFDEGIRPDVMELLEEQGIQHFTRWSNAEGRGETGPRHGDPVWPGLNDVLMVALDEAQVQPLVEALHVMRDSFPLTPGLRVMVLDALFV